MRLLGGCRSWLWQSTWGCWGQLGFCRAEALSSGVCSPALGAGGTEVLSCAREGGLSRAAGRRGWGWTLARLTCQGTSSEHLCCPKLVCQSCRESTWPLLCPPPSWCCWLQGSWFLQCQLCRLALSCWAFGLGTGVTSTGQWATAEEPKASCALQVAVTLAQRCAEGAGELRPGLCLVIYAPPIHCSSLAQCHSTSACIQL